MSGIELSPQSLLSKLDDLLANSTPLENSQFTAHGVDYAAPLDEMKKVNYNFVVMVINTMGYSIYSATGDMNCF